MEINIFIHPELMNSISDGIREVMILNAPAKGSPSAEYDEFFSAGFHVCLHQAAAALLIVSGNDDLLSDEMRGRIVAAADEAMQREVLAINQERAERN